MKVTDLELTPEAMMKMGEAALKAVVDHIKNLPLAQLLPFQPGKQYRNRQVFPGIASRKRNQFRDFA